MKDIEYIKKLRSYFKFNFRIKLGCKWFYDKDLNDYIFIVGDVRIRNEKYYVYLNSDYKIILWNRCNNEFYIDLKFSEYKRIVKYNN